MSIFIKLFIKNKEDVFNPSVKKAYAALSCIIGIVLNLFLCTVKMVVGVLSNSIAISADGLNNLSDAVTSLVSLLGFKIAKYGSGSVHTFGHGRIEWIMGVFTSIAVILMGIKLVNISVYTIINSQKTLFSAAVVIVLILSIVIKLYMYYYNKYFSKFTNSEALRATAADCISDAVATIGVLFSAIVSYMTNWEIDGYCGVLVSIFIIFVGLKSLWEVLGCIMGKAADKSTVEVILQMIKSHTEIVDVHNLMLHDYGFGYFVISMRVEGYKKDSEKLYTAINEVSYTLYKRFHCDCFIQIDYIIDNKILTEELTSKIYSVLKKYSNEMCVDNFRLIENGPYINVVFDMIYPAKLQKKEEEICNEITELIEADYSKYCVIIKGIIRRERFSLHKKYEK